MEAAHIPWRPLGRLLVEKGLLSDEQLECALDEQAITGRRLGEILVRLGVISHSTLSVALAEQYGFDLPSGSEFGTGLRAKIEGRDEPEATPARPALELVPELPADQEDPNVDPLHLAQLEEQWAKLAAAEARLAEMERKRRSQVVRLIERVRSRDRRLAELSAPSAPPEPVEGHLVLAQLGDGYELLELDGAPPAPDAVFELAGATFAAVKVGRSPLPNDSRSCVFAELRRASAAPSA